MLETRSILRWPAATMMIGFVVLLAGCPDDPYEASTWIKQLDDPNTLERALTELDHLKDPVAIPALGKAWEKYGPPRAHPANAYRHCRTDGRGRRQNGSRLSVPSQWPVLGSSSTIFARECKPIYRG